ncbi:ABC transporter ATP-binding protein [Clostridium pasteurianum]|uniref:ATP-binding cassette domain-containing protein n=1 Tax=Clostridium pasteurianum TaxID=1501 RepID=UPI002260F87E|nr:ABC transporter ATP-binding protein [Clostridium pasteurianum]UZW13410.1 ABC transporter ATP-binding protein [Clostridium pasteurianum]
MKTPVLKITNLEKRYKHQVALESTNLELYQGEICAIIGKNGAGKSTLFKMIAEETFSTKGEITLFGEPYGKHNARERMGVMIETNVFFDNFNAAQNLEYYRLQRGIPEKAIIGKVLNRIGLAEHQRKKFSEYSLGMKQRLSLALALLSSPDFLLLDEPINGLDVEGMVEMRQLFLKLNQEHQITILISSHILSELQSIATRFVFLNKGKVIQDLSRKELLGMSQQFILLRVNDAKKACFILENNFVDINYKVLASQQLEIYNYIADRQKINRLLNEGNVDILEMTVKSKNLEEYFLGLVGGNNNVESH